MVTGATPERAVDRVRVMTEPPAEPLMAYPVSPPADQARHRDADPRRDRIPAAGRREKPPEPAARAGQMPPPAEHYCLTTVTGSSAATGGTAGAPGAGIEA